MRAILCAILALPCTGCLVHTARVDGAGADQAAGRSATGQTVRDGAPSLDRSGPLPYEIPSVWMLKDADGRLCIGRATALSPLPWWQRFPVDFAVDLWPGQVAVAVTATVTPRPIIARTADDITAEARAHGYAE
jgi:hypothetical protein